VSFPPNLKKKKSKTITNKQLQKKKRKTIIVLKLVLYQSHLILFSLSFKVSILIVSYWKPKGFFFFFITFFHHDSPIYYFGFPGT